MEPCFHRSYTKQVLLTEDGVTSGGSQSMLVKVIDRKLVAKLLAKIRQHMKDL
jgi:hypothetical protein